MRTTTVENNQIVIRDSGVTVHYSLALVRKYLSKLESELATYKEYERLLTLSAADLPKPSPCSCGSKDGYHTQKCALLSSANR